VWGDLQTENEMAQKDQIGEVVTKIIRMINSGNYEPGERLKESYFSEKLGLSRVPIREALRILAGDGVVELVPNKGAVLRVIPPEEILEMIKVHDILVRYAVEEFIKIGNQEKALALLKKQLEKIENSFNAGNKNTLVKAIIQFHRIIIQYSNNSYLIKITGRHYLGGFQLHLRRTADFDMLKESCDLFPKIYQALKDRNTKKACDYMKQKNLGMVKNIEFSL
jgi:DNA-binding GntR family transcriptional regulator